MSLHNLVSESNYAVLETPETLPPLSSTLFYHARRHLQKTRDQIAVSAGCRPEDVKSCESGDKNLFSRPYSRKIARVLADPEAHAPLDASLDLVYAIRRAIRYGVLTAADTDLVYAIHRKVLPDQPAFRVKEALRIIAGDGLVIESRDSVFRLYESSPERLRECLQMRLDLEISCIYAVVSGEQARRRRVVDKMAHVLIRIWEAIRSSRPIRDIVFLDNSFHIAWADGSGEIANALDSLLLMPRVARDYALAEASNKAARGELLAGFSDLHRIWMALRERRPDAFSIVSLLCGHILRTWKAVDIPTWKAQRIVNTSTMKARMQDKESPEDRIGLLVSRFADLLGSEFWENLGEIDPELCKKHARPILASVEPRSAFRKRVELILSEWVGGASANRMDDALIALRVDLEGADSEQLLLDAVTSFHAVFRERLTRQATWLPSLPNDWKIVSDHDEQAADDNC